MKRVALAFVIVATLAACNSKTTPAIETESVVTKAEEPIINNIELVKEYFLHFNNHDWKKLGAMYTDTAYFKDPAYGLDIVVQTPEQATSQYSKRCRMFPDIYDQIKNIYPAADNVVVVEFIANGTATDSTRFAMPACTIFTFENGKIRKDYTYYYN